MFDCSLRWQLHQVFLFRPLNHFLNCLKLVFCYNRGRGGMFLRSLFNRLLTQVFCSINFDPFFGLFLPTILVSLQSCLIFTFIDCSICSFWKFFCLIVAVMTKRLTFETLWWNPLIKNFLVCVYSVRVSDGYHLREHFLGLNSDANPCKGHPCLGRCDFVHK